MLKLIDKLCNTLKLQLEQCSLTNDILETNLVRFLKDCVIYLFHIPIEQDIEQYFTISEIDKTMLNIQQYLNSISRKNHFRNIFKNEGFQSGEQSSSDEFDSIVQKKPKIHKICSLEHKPTDIPVSENDLTQLNTLQQLLYETNLKVTKRDEQILQMTTNYLKDIQHLKLMFLRQLENPDAEFFEVNYFDIKQALEPELQNYIQDKFNQLQKQCQQTVQRYKIELTALSTECESHKRTISVLLQNNTLQSIIKMLFLIEKDPYKIWKQIQEQVGNKIIFQVFENQIGGYGINYREIDELISKNSSGSRMFQRLKQLYEDQLKIMIDENIQIIDNLKQEIKIKDQTIEELQVSREESVNKVYEQQLELLWQKLKEQQLNLSSEYEKKLKSQQRDLSDPQLIRKITMKSTFARWRNFSKFYQLFEQELDEDSLYELKQRINHCLKQVNDEFTVKDYEKLIQNYQQAQYNIIKIEQEKSVIEQKYKSQQLEIQKCKNTISMLSQTIQSLKQDLQNSESTVKLITKPFCSILQKLGYPSKLNLLAILKSGINLDFLQNDDPEIQSSLITFFQLTIAQQIIHQSKLKREAETITEFFDIRYAISQELNEDSNFQYHQSQSPEVPLIQLQITDLATSPKDQANFSNMENKFPIKGTQKTSNYTNQTPKSNRVQNYSQINTPKISQKDRKSESIAIKRDKKSQQQLIETPSNGFQKQVEKVRIKEHLMIQEINYQDQGIQVDMDFQSTRFKNSPQVQFRDIERSSPQQDVLVIMREDGDSRSSSVTKHRSVSQNNRKQQFNIPNQFINNQNLTLYQASKQKAQNRTIYSEQHQIQQNLNLGLSLLPTSPFQFYQELFKEKQKLQMKNYTIIKNQGIQIQNINKRKLEPSIEGKHLQIPSYLK